MDYIWGYFWNCVSVHGSERSDKRTSSQLIGCIRAGSSLAFYHVNVLSAAGFCWVGCWGLCSSSSSLCPSATWEAWTKVKNSRQRHSQKSSLSTSFLLSWPLSPTTFYVWSLRHQKRKKKKKKDPLPKDREKVGRGINSLWRLPRGSFLTAWLEPSNISDPAIFFLGCCGRIQWCKEHLSWKKITSIGKEHSLHFFPTFHQNACHKSFKWNLRKHYYGISLGSVSNYILSLLYLTG